MYKHVDYLIHTRAIVKSFAGGHGENASSLQFGIDQILELSHRVYQILHIYYNVFDEPPSNEFYTQQPWELETQYQGARRSTPNVPRPRSVKPHVDQLLMLPGDPLLQVLTGLTLTIVDIESADYGVSSRFAREGPSTMVGLGHHEAGPSQNHPTFDIQWGELTDVHLELQLQGQHTQASYMHIPSWMSLLGFPPSSFEQNILNQQQQQHKVGTSQEREDEVELLARPCRPTN